MSKKKSTVPGLPEGLTVRYEHRRVVVPNPNADPLGLDAMTISPRGGTTIAYLRRGQETVAVGVALCSPKDNYRRSIGRLIALSRALKTYENPPATVVALGQRVLEQTQAVIAEELAHQWTQRP